MARLPTVPPFVPPLRRFFEGLQLHSGDKKTMANPKYTGFLSRLAAAMIDAAIVQKCILWLTIVLLAGYRSQIPGLETSSGVAADLSTRLTLAVDNILVLPCANLSLLASCYTDPYVWREALLHLIATVIICQIVFNFAYHTIFESSRLRATPGKLLLGLTVVNEAGHRINFRQACLRHIAKCLSTLTLLWGFFISISNGKKQTLHDMLSKCFVVSHSNQSILLRWSGRAAFVFAGLYFLLLALPMLGEEAKSEGKTAIIDKSGRRTHDVEFNYILPFKGGSAPVQIRNKWGYVNSKGQLFIPARFAQAGYFENDTATVAVENPNNWQDLTWGMIDKSGKFLIEPRFKALGNYHEGLAYAAIKTPAGIRYGFIDKSKVFVIKPQFEWARDFSEGLAAVKLVGSRSSAHSYCDLKGKIVIPEKFEYGQQFKNGIAKVRKADKVKYTNVEGLGYVVLGGEEDIDIFIDKQGNVLSKEKKLRLVPHESELTPVGKNGLFGFEDRFGKLVLTPEYRRAMPFSDGYSVVVPRTGPFAHGVIDRSGRLVCPAEFFEIRTFSNGLAAAQLTQGSKWGFIDPSGKFVIPPQFDEIGDFSEGLAAAGFDGGWAEMTDARTQVYLLGYIDKSGAFVIKPKFREANQFHNGVAIVQY